MQRKKLKKLIIASYDNEKKLIPENISRIALQLSRKELKEYIRTLRQFEKKKQLVVDCSFVPSANQEDVFKEQFPGREIVFHFKPDLLFGVRVTDNDIVYSMNLRRTLEAIEEFIDNQYD